MAAPERDAVPVPVSVPISVEAVLRELALFELRCDGEDATDKREGEEGLMRGRFGGALGITGADLGPRDPLPPLPPMVVGPPHLCAPRSAGALPVPLVGPGDVG